MNIKSIEFKQLLATMTDLAENYIAYSPSQIARGDHLKHDPTQGEHAWSIPETTGRFLYNTIIKLGCTTGLELGTSIGYSTMWIMAAFSENSKDSTLITIEQSVKKYELAQENLKPLFGDSIEFHNKVIKEYLPTLSINRTFDFIFMDADRGNYFEYWNYIKKFLNKKSIVIIDNALRAQKSVTDFQNYLKSDLSLSIYLHPIDNGLFIVSLSNGDYSDLHSVFSHN